jgi:predicted nucleic acid-binding protein
LIFLDTNVLSETLRKSPNPTVIAWLVRHDADRDDRGNRFRHSIDKPRRDITGPNSADFAP